MAHYEEHDTTQTIDALVLAFLHDIFDFTLKILTANVYINHPVISLLGKLICSVFILGACWSVLTL